MKFKHDVWNGRAHAAPQTLSARRWGNAVMRHENRTLAMLTLLALAASGFHPFDRLTWVLETLPVMLGLPLLIAWSR